MNITERFQQYAAAFEETYIDDDWSRLEPFFAVDATYEVLGMPQFPINAEGRDAVFAALKESVDSFDRRFDSRKLQILAPPEVAGSSLKLRWGGSYGREGVPDFAFEGVEEAHYNEAGEIARLVDTYEESMAEAAKEWLGKYGKSLKPIGDSKTTSA